MATTYLDPQQSAPAAATPTTLYTVTSAKTLVEGAIVVCNTNTTSTNFTIALIVSGDSIATKCYLYKNLPICGNDTFDAVKGLTLKAGGVVQVTSADGGVAFTLTGAEIDN